MPNHPALDAITARWVPWVVAFAFFMQSLDGTILNTALPAMSQFATDCPVLHIDSTLSRLQLPADKTLAELSGGWR